MAFKMKGSFHYGKDPLKQKKKSQADEAKEVVAKNTSDKELKDLNIEDVSAVQEDKEKNKFVVTTKEDESYSGDDDNVIQRNTGDINNPSSTFDLEKGSARDTFLVKKSYKKGDILDEFDMKEGTAQVKKKKKK